MDQIMVVYWSQTGNTEAMANAVAEGIRKAGKDALVTEVSHISVDALWMGGWRVDARLAGPYGQCRRRRSGRRRRHCPGESGRRCTQSVQGAGRGSGGRRSIIADS